MAGGMVMKTRGYESSRRMAEAAMKSAVETHFWLEARRRRRRERWLIAVGSVVGIAAFLGTAFTQIPDVARGVLYVLSGLGFGVALVLLSTRRSGRGYYNGPS